MRCICIALFPFVAVGCSEIVESEADSYAQAKLLIDSGWLPSWIPKSATSILEAHDIDTNAVVASFDANDESWGPAGCNRIEPLDAPVPDVSVPWWPGDVPVSQSLTHRHIFYQCKNNTYLAVTPDGKEVNYWSNAQ